MTAPNIPFHLHASASASDAPVAPDENLPAQVAGQPASYFWKEMIHPGKYVHPTRGFSLAVDHARLRQWARTGAAMLAEGVAIPINCDHSDRARDVVGYVKQFKLEGPRLMALCQFIGDDAALTAARNLVSVGIDPNFTDGQARNWGEAIVHLALTPVPVVSDQGQFVQASMNDSMGDDDQILLTAAQETTQPANTIAIACTADQWQLLSRLLPHSEDLTPENCIQRIIERLQIAAAADVSHEGDDEEDDSDLRAELATARRRLLELSSGPSPGLSEESAAAMVESATAKFDAAVARGGLSPIARDRLIATLVRTSEGRANLIALSRAANPQGDRALALAVADILLENQPIIAGEVTSLQALSRAVPGEESSPVDQLRQYMTKIASVSG